ncbi:MAG: TIM-barrel domain-containing protein, partial [Terriglobia bacterium]
MGQQSHAISRRNAIALLGSSAATILIGPTPGNSHNAGADRTKTLSVAGQAVELQITVVNPRVLRISLLPIVRGKAEPIKQSLVLVPAHWPAPTMRVRSEAEKKIPWGSMWVSVSPAPLRIAIESRAGERIQQLDVDSRNGAVRFALGEHPIYGLGEGGKQFDRRGVAYPMKHGEGVPGLRTDGARLPIPWLVCTEGWGLFFHLPLGIFDLSSGEGLFQARPGQSNLPLDVFLVVSSRPVQIMAEYARLTGFPHMPPIWSLGYQQSHRTLSSRHEVMSELRTFRHRRLPCDVMIYLGTGFCPSGWN